MVYERLARGAQNFLLNDLQIDLGIRLCEHPVPLGTLLQAHDVQLIHAFNPDRLQVRQTQSTRIGSDDANFAIQATDLPCQQHLQQAGSKYRHARGRSQFPLEDGIEATTRGDGLYTLRHHRPGVGDHRCQNGRIWFLKNRMHIGTPDVLKPDRISIRRGVGAVARQGFELLEPPGHMPFFPT